MLKGTNHEWTSASLVINIVITELLIIIRLRQSRKHQRFWASPGRYTACPTLVSWFTALSLFWTCLWLIPTPVWAQKGLIACKKLLISDIHRFSLEAIFVLGTHSMVLGETRTAFVHCSCHYRQYPSKRCLALWQIFTQEVENWNYS